MTLPTYKELIAKIERESGQKVITVPKDGKLRFRLLESKEIVSYFSDTYGMGRLAVFQTDQGVLSVPMSCARKLVDVISREGLTNRSLPYVTFEISRIVYGGISNFNLKHWQDTLKFQLPDIDVDPIKYKGYMEYKESKNASAPSASDTCRCDMKDLMSTGHSPSCVSTRSKR